jgi:hypothetical protein
MWLCYCLLLNITKESTLQARPRLLSFFLLFVFIRVLLDHSCYTKFLSALVSSRTLLFASQNLASISISLGRSTSF